MRTRATFRLRGGAGLTAEAVTRRLGLRPTGAIEAGEPISRRSARARDSSPWLLSSTAGIEAGVELATQLDRLLAILEPVTPLRGRLLELPGGSVARRQRRRHGRRAGPARLIGGGRGNRYL